MSLPEILQKGCDLKLGEQVPRQKSQDGVRVGTDGPGRAKLRAQG